MVYNSILKLLLLFFHLVCFSTMLYFYTIKDQFFSPLILFSAGFRNGIFPVSQVVQFQDFLLRANKYNCLKMVGDGGAPDHKLILVEVRIFYFQKRSPSILTIMCLCLCECCQPLRCSSSTGFSKPVLQATGQPS